MDNSLRLFFVSMLVFIKLQNPLLMQTYCLCLEQFESLNTHNSLPLHFLFLIPMSLWGHITHHTRSPELVIICLRFSYYIHTHTLTELSPTILLFLPATEKQHNIKYTYFSDLVGEKWWNHWFKDSTFYLACFHHVLLHQYQPTASGAQSGVSRGKSTDPVIHYLFLLSVHCNGYRT